MTGQGVIVKRCGCLETGTRRRQGRRCPRLTERGHGTWYFHCSVSTIFGRRERVRRGGYATRHAAELARDELLERSRAERTTATWTVARWLRYWLSTRTSIRPSTIRSYTEHVERHLIPHLGRIRLGELTGRDVAAMFTALIATGHPLWPADLALHPAPHPRHAALGIERGDPRRAAARQPGPVHRTTHPAPTPAAGVDRAAGRGVAAR